MHSWCSKCKKWFVQQQTYSIALSVSCILELVATQNVAVTLLKKKDFLTAMYINEKAVLKHIYRESLQVTHIQGLSH